MICRLGLLFVVAHAALTSAMPSCACTREFKPVCGSDGQNYGNLCLLGCQQQEDPSLQLASYGRCRSSKEIGNDEQCICTLEYDPVCASDGHTYPNKCAANCSNRSLDIVHYGECRQKRQAAERVCACPFIYAPVCGTDGNTYSNECSLKCTDNVDVAYRGTCRAKRQTCPCPLIYRPVCGSDGKTYANLCDMDCEKTGIVKLAYEGPCRIRREVESEGPACFCTYENDPVCGSNGKTYANQCMLECEGETVQLAYKGDCRAKRESVQIAKLPLCQCTREAHPVCGTDGKTYSNPCLLNCSKEQNEDLEIAHAGSCKNKKALEVGTKPGPGCSCTRIMQPVCASNGVTFSNECLMRCAGQHLTVEKYGRCDNA